MASKGWSLLLVMLSMLVGVLVTGTLNQQTEAIVQVSPQGSAVIFANEATRTASGTVKNIPVFGLPTRPLLDVSAAPAFRLPPQEDITSERTEAFDTVAPNGLNCSLYH